MFKGNINGENTPHENFSHSFMELIMKIMLQTSWISDLNKDLFELVLFFVLLQLRCFGRYIFRYSSGPLSDSLSLSVLQIQNLFNPQASIVPIVLFIVGIISH